MMEHKNNPSGSGHTPHPAETTAQERLVRLFHQAAGNPLALQAIADKTQGVSSFLARSGARVIWLQLSEADNLTPRFWEHFVLALSMWSKRLARKAREVGFPANTAAFQRFFADFSRQAHSADLVVVVCNNYHLVKNPAVRRFVQALIDGRLENLSIVIFSGAWIQLDSVVFENTGRAVKLTDRQLRFTPEEVEAYYSSLDIHLTPQQLQDIYEYTGGWAFAIYMVGAFLQRGEYLDHDPLQYAIPIIIDLIDREVYSRYPQSLKNMLAPLALLDGFTIDLATQVTGAPPEELATFLDNSLFVVYNPHTRQFQLYQLFREFLQHKPERITGERRRTIYRTAARWQSERGLYAEAVSYYALSGDYDEMLQLITTRAIRRMSRDLAARCIRLLDELPAEFQQRNPMVAVVRAFMLYNNLEVDAAYQDMLRLKEDLEARPETEQTRAVLGEAYTLLAVFSMIRRSVAFRDYFKKACDCLPDGSILFSDERQFLGNDNAMIYGPPEPDGLFKMLEVMRETEPYAMHVLRNCGYGLTDLAAAEAHYFAGSLKLAEQYAFQAIYISRDYGQWDIICRGHLVLMRTSFARGRYDDVIRHLSQVQQYGKMVKGREFFTIPDLAAGWLGQRLGLIDHIAPWIRDDALNSRVTVPLSVGKDRLLRASYLLQKGRLSEALGFLEESMIIAHKRAQHFIYLQIRIIRAIAFHLDGREEDAVEELEVTYKLSHYNSLVMPYVEAGNAMRNLLDLARARGGHHIPDRWIDALYARCSTYIKRQAHIKAAYEKELGVHKSPVSKLSRREREVLDCLTQGLTRQEIADELEISINTVKRTIQNIYNKLGAVNRADAVHMAAVMRLEEQSDALLIRPSSSGK